MVSFSDSARHSATPCFSSKPYTVVRQPRCVTELERAADVARQGRKKIAQQPFIAFQRGRKLKQHRPQPPRGPQRIDGAKEHLGELRRFQPQNVRDPHVRFQRETRSLAAYRSPSSQASKPTAAAGRCSSPPPRLAASHSTTGISCSPASPDRNRASNWGRRIRKFLNKALGIRILASMCAARRIPYNSLNSSDSAKGSPKTFVRTPSRVVAGHPRDDAAAPQGAGRRLRADDRSAASAAWCCPLRPNT